MKCRPLISRKCLRQVLLGFLGLLLPAPVHAQVPLLLDGSPAELAREVFDRPYGQKLLDGLGTALINGAPAECRREKQLDLPEMTRRGGDIFRRYGAQTIEKLNANSDTNAHKDALAKMQPEVSRLLKNAAVKSIYELDKTAKFRKLADFIGENFDRYVLIKRIKLAPVTPAGSGNTALMAMGDALEENLQKAIERSRAPQVARYVTLMSQAQAVPPKISLRPEDAPRGLPALFFSGVEAELTDLCIQMR